MTTYTPEELQILGNRAAGTVTLQENVPAEFSSVRCIERTSGRKFYAKATGFIPKGSKITRPLLQSTFEPYEYDGYVPPFPAAVLADLHVEQIIPTDIHKDKIFDLPNCDCYAFDLITGTKIEIGETIPNISVMFRK